MVSLRSALVYRWMNPADSFMHGFNSLNICVYTNHAHSPPQPTPNHENAVKRHLNPPQPMKCRETAIQSMPNHGNAVKGCHNPPQPMKCRETAIQSMPNHENAVKRQCNRSSATRRSRGAEKAITPNGHRRCPPILPHKKRAPNGHSLFQYT